MGLCAKGFLMSYDLAIHLKNVGKQYQIYDKPSDRLRSMFPWNRSKTIGRTFHALHDITLDVAHGEVVGIVGRNGAGKSTLLQIVAQTISASHGEAQTNGKVSALLELGSGFNPEFSGRENVYLAAAIAGLTQKEADQKFDEIVAFSGIGEFIDQPIKNYSSGMMVRLAFSVATSVEPDILIVDEALSVGDGAFARKSFERIMTLKDRGCTILFCSHSLFQIESLCNRAIWIEKGQIQEDGIAANVVAAYQNFLDTLNLQESIQPQQAAVQGHARFTKVIVDLDGKQEGLLKGFSCRSTLSIYGEFVSDVALPCPSAAVTLSGPDGRILSSAGAWNDEILLERDTDGLGKFSIHFPSIALLKGRYHVGVHLFCERGLHIYDWADPVAIFELEQTGIQQGIVELEHRWGKSIDD